jgi:uncharacterized OB-fold protein
MLIQCPFCNPNTAGEHEPHCPNNPNNYAKTEYKSQGWQCPKCGRVWAPWVQQCTCTQPNLDSNLTNTKIELRENTTRRT